MSSDPIDSSTGEVQDPEGLVPLAFGIGFDKRGCLAEVRRKTRNCCLFSLSQILLTAGVAFAVGHELKQANYPWWQCGLASLGAGLLGLFIIDTGLLILASLPSELHDACHPLVRKPSGILSSAYVLNCLWGIMIGAAVGAYPSKGWLWSTSYLLTISLFSWLMMYLAIEWKLDKLPSCLGGLTMLLLPLVLWHLGPATYPHWWVGGLIALGWSELFRQAILRVHRRRKADNPA